MAGGFLARAGRALRDPWSLVVAGIGAGSAWAIGLPVGAVGLVGAGMLGAAAVVGGAVRSDSATPEELPAPPLRPGTVQSGLLGTLTGYRTDLEQLQRQRLEPAVAMSATEAVDAARSAEAVANRVARAVDAVDEAVGRAQGVARQLPRSAEVRGSVQRMTQRRDDLLRKLSEAVEEVGEVYAKLLELSTTADLVGVDTDGVSEAARVNDSLDAIRSVFAELEADASATRALL
jgi:nucleoid-associated protein YgaU